MLGQPAELTNTPDTMIGAAIHSPPPRPQIAHHLITGVLIQLPGHPAWIHGYNCRAEPLYAPSKNIAVTAGMIAYVAYGMTAYFAE